jgi:iron complex outermembrane receptor protein
MIMKIRKTGQPCALVASAMVLVASVATAAQAQEAPADRPVETSTTPSDQAPATIGDIVVTAQRRAERLQRVPIAVSALGSQAIEAMAITDLSNLRGMIPSVSITGFVGVNASNLVAIRGVNGQPIGIGASQATAIYLDGVYLARPDGAFFGLDDVERIEVLRGPQGTLYGRNATAGAVNIITRKPDETLRGSVGVSYGNFNAVQAKGSISGPIGGGFYAGFSGSYETRDGYYINTVTGHRVGEKDAFTVRGKLRYANDDESFELVISPDYTRNRSHEFAKGVLDPLSTVLGGTYIGMGDPGTLASNIENDTRFSLDSYGGGLSIVYQASDAITLTAISGYRNLKVDTSYDGDGSAQPIFRTYSQNRSKSFNQELRFLYQGDKLKVTAGGNFFHEDATYFFVGNPPGDPFTYRSPFSTSDLDAYGLFSQVEYEIVDRLTLVGGLRFNYEKRDFSVDYTRALPIAGTFGAGKVKDSEWIPAVGLNFQANPDVLLYGKVSKGYQSPGFNPGPGRTAGLNTFGAETLIAYELGAKTQFLDRHLTLNGALFYYDYKGIQVRSLLNFGEIRISNAANATIKGGEIEIVMRPNAELTFSGHATYSKATYGPGFCEVISPGNLQAANRLCAPGLVDRTGNTLNNAPRWTAGANLNWAKPLTDRLTLNFNTSLSFESKVYFTTANEIGASNKGWERLDARLGLELGNGLEFYVFGKNLTDYRYIAEAIRLNNSVSYAFLNDPRTYGVGARFKF